VTIPDGKYPLWGYAKATLFRGGCLTTLAVRAFELASDERLAASASAAMAIVAAGLIPVIVLSQTISRSRPGARSGPGARG
jgi:ABC-type Fe3+ transport system permease subunit